jgi:hypothetical protein
MIRKFLLAVYFGAIETVQPSTGHPRHSSSTRDITHHRQGLGTNAVQSCYPPSLDQYRNCALGILLSFITMIATSKYPSLNSALLAIFLGNPYAQAFTL